MRFTSTTPQRLRRSVGVSAAAAAALTLGAAAARADEGPTTHAVCTSTITLYLTPGFSATPAASTVTSRGETGTVVCVGTLSGRRITGPGTFGVDEVTQAGCLTDHSSGQVSTTLPTTGGPIRMIGGLSGRRLGLLEFADVDFPQGRFTGFGPVLPTRGDCLIAPITRALVSITGVLEGES